MRRDVFLILFVCSLFFTGGYPDVLCANPFFEQKSGPSAPVIARGPGFVKQQLAFRERVALLMRELRERRSPAAIVFVALFSMLYGLFHALGPGHRKTVLFTLFLSRKRHCYEPLIGGVLSAAVHAISSILLISVLYFLISRVHLLAKSEEAYALMENSTFLLLGVIAFVLILLRIRSLFFKKTARSARNDKYEKSSFYAIITLASLVPCPGASMLLLLAIYSDLYYIGIIGVIAMSLGMAVVTSVSAYLGWAGREGLFFTMKSRERLMLRLSAVLELFSYLLILVFSFAMTLPFLRSIC